MVDRPTVQSFKLVKDSERTKRKLLIFCMVLIFALILTTFGISFICWIDDKKSHLKHTYAVVGNIILICWKFTAVSSFEKTLANRSRILTKL